MGIHLTVVLKEMCKRVGADFEKINFKKTDWYRKHAWTVAEEDAFKKWLVGYWKKNSAARNEMLMLQSATTANRLERAADGFLLNYGWTYKEQS